MARGDPGKEAFRNAIVTLRNHDIATGLQPLMELRRELVHSEDLMSRGGLDTASRDHFVTHLARCDQFRRRVTHNPSGKPLKVLIAEAKDPTGEIESGAMPFAGDEIQQGSTGLYILMWDLSGADVDIPLASTLTLSGFGELFLLAIDSTIVAWTRLESRHRSRGITMEDSTRIYHLYQRIFDGLMAFAGDDNYVDIAQGVLASEEPRGPENAPLRKTETAGGEK